MLLWVLGGCAEDLDLYQPTTGQTQAVFDPSATDDEGNPAPDVPTPTDLVRDPTTGMLQVPVADKTKKPAQAAFDTYLNTLNGFPTSATAEMFVTGELDTSTVSKATILVYDITNLATTGNPTLVDGSKLVFEPKTLTDTTGSTEYAIRIWNPSGWTRGSSYAIYVLGGSKGIKDKQGQPIIRSALFDVAVGSSPLCEMDTTKSWDSTAKACAAPATGKKATGCCTFNYSGLIESAVKKATRAKLESENERLEEKLTLEEIEKAAKAEVLGAATSFELIRLAYTKLLQALPTDAGASADVVLLWSFSVTGMNEAIFDPSASRIPTPNDLAFQPTGDPLTGQIQVSSTASKAEKEFTDYLNSLGGWPNTSGSLSFTAELDSSSVTSGFLVYEVSSTGLKAVTSFTPSYSSTAKNVSLLFTGGLKRKTKYAIFALAGKTGLQNKDATLATAPSRSAMMELALSKEALCTFDTTKKACTDVKVTSFIDDPFIDDASKKAKGAMKAEEKATIFETLRQGYDALLKLLEATGKAKREEVVALWTFTTTPLTEVVYDPTAGVIPFPNNLLLDTKTGLVNIPASANETATEKALRQGLNTLDGFTTQGSYYATYSGEVDKSSLVLGTSVVSLDLDSKLPYLAWELELQDKAPAIVATPKTPLAEKTNYGLVLVSVGSKTKGDLKATAGLKDKSGYRLVGSTFTALVRNRYELYKDSKSTLSTLDDATAKTLEMARVAHKPLFDSLEAQGIAREDIAAAWTFKTQSITEPLTKLRALPYSVLGAKDLNKPAFSGTLDTTLTGFPTTTFPYSNLGGWVPDGKFTSYLALDESGTQALFPPADIATKGKTKSLSFMMTIPKTTMPTTGYPVVLFQHGLGRSMTDFLAIADTLAYGGFATISFDAIYHGGRSWCTKNDHCTTGLCNTKTGCCESTAGTCNGTLKKDTTGLPDASGLHFLNTANPFAVRDNFRQHVVDAAAMLRAIALGAASGITGGVTLDPAGVHYVGQSLGAILGTLVLATDSVPKRGVLNVPGAPVVDIILTGTSFKTIKDALLQSMNVTEGSLDYLKLVTTFKWILDPADPGNFGKYVQIEGLPDLTSTSGGKVPTKDAIVMLAGQDQTIPKKLGEYLAGLIGISSTELAKTTYANQGHGFLLKPDPSTSLAATKAAQTQVVTFLLTGNVCTPDTTAGTCL